jgi:hypothetical protein
MKVVLVPTMPFIGPHLQEYVRELLYLTPHLQVCAGRNEICTTCSQA